MQAHSFSYARYAAHNFMPKDERKFRIVQFAINHMQIGPADGANKHSELNLAVQRFRHWPVAEGEGFASLLENHGAHEFILAHCDSAIPVAQASTCGFWCLPRLSPTD
jgi:hypothetical protein